MMFVVDWWNIFNCGRRHSCWGYGTVRHSERGRWSLAGAGGWWPVFSSHSWFDTS